jgi:hypothetical protein
MLPPMNRILSAAQTIAAARRHRTALPALDADIAPHDEAEGYLIQAAVADLLSPDFGAQVGYKIGCTSAVMQQYLDIPHPCGGSVFARGVHESGASLRHSDFVRVGVECEIAVRLARDLAPSAAPFTAEAVAQAVEAYLPAIEIVDDRYVDWQTLGAPTLMALSSPPVACSENPLRGQSPPICWTWSAVPSSTARRQGGAAAPTCSGIHTMRWRGSPTISRSLARACARARSF